MASPDLAFIIRARDEASKVLDGLRGQVTGLGSMLGSGLAMAGTAALAGGAAIAGGMALGVKSAGDLQQAVANIQTIKPTIDTSAVFDALNEMQTRVPQSAAQLGDALYNVFSSIDVDQAGGLKLAETFAKGATAAQTDAQTFGTAVLGVMNAYKLGVEDANHISDVFFNTINAGVVTGEELAASMGPVTQSAKAAGVSLDQLGAFMAAVTKEGGPASQNINNLNNFFQKLTTQSAQKAFSELGIAATDASGKFRDPIEVLEDLKSLLGDLSQSQAAEALQMIFPDAQARLGAQTLISQLDTVKSVLEQNQTAAGATKNAYEIMSATFNSQVKILQNSFQSILTTLGAAALPLLTPLISALATALPGAFNTAKDALAPFVEAITSLGRYFIEVVQGGDTLNDYLADLPTPIQGVVQAIGELVNWFADLRTRAEPVMRVLADSWRTVLQVFARDWEASDQIQPLTNSIGILATWVRDKLIPAFQQVATAVMPAVSAALNFASERFAALIDWGVATLPLLLAAFDTVFGGIGNFLREHSDVYLPAIQAGWQLLTTSLTAAFELIGGGIRALLKLLSGDWQGAWEEVKETTLTIAADLVPGLQATWDSLQRAWQAMLDHGQRAAEENGRALQSYEDELWSGIQSTIDGALDTIKSAVTEKWNAAREVVQSVQDQIKSAVMAVWNALPEDIRSDLVLIYDHVSGKFGEMLTAASGKATELWTAVKGKWAEMTAGTGEELGKTSTAAATKFDEMKSAIDTRLEPIKSAALAIATGIRDTFGPPLSQVVSNVGSWLGQIGGSIAATTEPLRNAAANLGSAIMQGIRNAIRAGADAIGDLLYRIARNALDKAKEAIGLGGGGSSSSPEPEQEPETGPPPPTRPPDDGEPVPGVAFHGGLGGFALAHAGAAPVQVHFHGAVFGLADVQTAVLVALDEAQRRGRTI
jgi:TP901 family phage tail tape measure protein